MALANLPDYQKLCIERSGNLYTTALLEGVRVAVPEECFDDEHRVDLGGVTVVARHLPGHTRSDIAVEVPEDGTVFAGDLVYNDMPPNLKFGNPVSWVRAMDSLLATRALVVVPGHGSLCGRTRLEELRAVLTAAAGVVQEITGKGSCDEKSLAARLGVSEGSAHRLWGIARTGEEWPAWPYEANAKPG
jgi:glyoxylase-like metal-dependent hydrolase (beta-lactamase superfamily II)